MNWVNIKARVRHFFKPQSASQVEPVAQQSLPTKPIVRLTIAEVQRFSQLETQIGPLSAKQWYSLLLEYFDIFEVEDAEEDLYSNFESFLTDSQCYQGHLKPGATINEMHRYAFQTGFRRFFHGFVATKGLGLKDERLNSSYSLVVIELAMTQVSLNRQNPVNEVVKAANTVLAKIAKHLPENYEIIT